MCSRLYLLFRWLSSDPDVCMASGKGQLQRELQPLPINGAAVRLLNGSCAEATQATKRQRPSDAGSQGSTATGSGPGTPLGDAGAGIKSEFLASLTVSGAPGLRSRISLLWLDPDHESPVLR